MASQKAQKALQRKLEEYGDSLLYDDVPSGRNKKQNLKKKDQRHQHLTKEKTRNVNQPSNMTKNMKRKLKKKQKKLLKLKQHGDIVKSKDSPVLCKRMKWLKETLGSETFEISCSTSSFSEDTVRETVVESKKKEPEVIIFEDPTRKKKKNTDNVGEDDSNVFNMATARFEVRKLGISGFGGERKSDARQSLLKSLGAKPTKNKSYVNYKEFQRQRKAELDSERSKADMPEGSKLQKKDRPGKKKSQKRSKDKDDIVDFDLKVGHYKNGVQFISRDTMKKMKSLNHT